MNAHYLESSMIDAETKLASAYKQRQFISRSVSAREDHQNNMSEKILRQVDFAIRHLQAHHHQLCEMARTHSEAFDRYAFPLKTFN